MVNQSETNKEQSATSGSPAGSRVTLSLAEVRAIALRSQGLADDLAPFGLGKDAVLKTIQHLGYVQVDTISVLQRAHHHVIWSRVPGYKPDMLHELQSPDAAVFEYWNHATSFLPTCDYRFSLPLMRKYRTELHWSDPSPELEKAIKRMASLIRKKGPLMIRDVESAGSVRQWSKANLGKIERRALHELWIRGEIMIRSRHGFEKVFDLPSRVLPETTHFNVPSHRDAADFHVRRGLRALGVARSQELHYLQDAGQASDVRAALSKLVDNGEAIEVRVPEYPKIPVFALREALELAAPLKENRMRFLSPFDNLTIQRKRLKWLFDFDYSVEIYVPAAKRMYGYFVLPILWGDRLIGRLDAKANRPERQLIIHNLVFEPSFTDWQAARPVFLEALRNFSSFQQCDDWKLSRVEPKAFKIS